MINREEFNDLARRHDKLERNLICAADRGDAVEVDRLIKAGADIFVDSEYPLYLAASNGHLETVKVLVGAGSYGTMRYNAPMYIAKVNGYTEIADFLKSEMIKRRDRVNKENPRPKSKP